jgi:molecular chaperone GrpE
MPGGLSKKSREPHMTETDAANNNTMENPTGASADADSAALAKEAADLKDKLLRSLAEMENLRRRTEREVADTRAYSVTGFAQDMIKVADNLRRTLEAAAASRAGNDGAAKTFLEGVELTERELLKVLEKHGVKKFDPQGAKFDPNLHEAMFEVPDPNVPSGMVAMVIQPGYTIGDRVLACPRAVPVPRRSRAGRSPSNRRRRRSARRQTRLVCRHLFVPGDPVAHGAETWKRRGPLVGSGNSDHPNKRSGRKAHPLDDLDRDSGPGVLGFDL